MIKEDKTDSNIEIEDYIGEEYYKCLYLFLDYKKYGLKNANVMIWYQEIDGDIRALILKYYSGMHIFSRNNDFNVNEIVQLIEKEKPTMICGEKGIVRKLENALTDLGYESEYGYVRELASMSMNKHADVTSANSMDEFKGIATLLFDDDDIGSSYTLEELTKQIIERNREKYGRNYIIKDGDKIIAHAGTGAENEKVAMLSYVITHPDYRKQGYAMQVCSAVCNDLISEGKKVYLINYSNESTKLYDKLGFKVCCEWGKLFLNLKKEGK